MLGVIPAEATHYAPKEKVFILDQTSANFDGSVERTITRFNEVMPNRGPLLVYVRGNHEVCASAIVSVCSGDLGEHTAGLAYTTLGSISLSDSLFSHTPMTEGGIDALVCHELMHILTHVGDQYSYDPITRVTTWLVPGLDSCVHGMSIGPGAYDVQLLADHYSTEKLKKDRKRERREKRHEKHRKERDHR